jgi:hypothetical protein
MEQINIPEWMLDSQNSSLTLSPDPAEIFASSFTKLNLHDVNIPDNLSLGSLLQAIYTTCGLLRVLATSTFSKPTLTAGAMKLYMTLVLDQNQRLWDLLLSILDCSEEPVHQLSYLIEQFFLGLQELMLHLLRPGWRGAIQQKISFLWSECIAEMINISQGRPSSVLTDRIISVLETTTELSSRIPELASAVCESTQPATNALLEEKLLPPAFRTRLQVRHLSYEVAI